MRQKRLTPPRELLSSSSLQKLEQEKNDEEEDDHELYNCHEENNVDLDNNYDNEDESASDESDEEEGDDEASDDHEEDDSKIHTKSELNDSSVMFTTSPDTMNSENITSLQYAEESSPLEINEKRAHETLPKILQPHPPFTSRRKNIPPNSMSTNYRLTSINLISSSSSSLPIITSVSQPISMSSTQQKFQVLPLLSPKEYRLYSSDNKVKAQKKLNKFNQ